MRAKKTYREKLDALMVALANEKSGKWISVLEYPQATEKHILKEKIRLETEGRTVKTCSINDRLCLLRKLTKLEFTEYQDEMKRTHNIEGNTKMYWYKTLIKNYIKSP